MTHAIAATITTPPKMKTAVIMFPDTPKPGEFPGPASSLLCCENLRT
jgi:hypothetical protein